MSEPQTLSYETTETKLSGVGIGTIALQVVGVWFIAMALATLPLMLTYIRVTPAFTGGQLLLIAAEALVNCAMGCGLIWLAPWISFRLFRDNHAGLMVGPVTSSFGQSIQAIAFSVLGLYLIAAALPQLVVDGLFWFRTPGSTLSPMDLTRPFVAFFIGLVLFLQSKALSRLWHRLRDGPAPITNIHSDSDQA
jgi:hypothetical protein